MAPTEKTATELAAQDKAQRHVSLANRPAPCTQAAAVAQDIRQASALGPVAQAVAGPLVRMAQRIQAAAAVVVAVVAALES